MTKRLFAERAFIVRLLQEEWDRIERTAKREELVRRAKAGARFTGELFLTLLMVGGVLTVAAVAPNLFGAYAKLSGRRNFFAKKQLRTAKNYLQRCGYIKVKREGNDAFTVRITRRGINRVLKERFETLAIRRERRWDGLWRLVVFDIPERKKHEREMLRARLRAMGLYPLQESVFVSPYPCEEEIRFVVRILNIVSHVRLIVATSITDAEDLREYFELR